MTKRISKAKEPIKIRLKQLANGNQSIYLDIYHNGKRSYEFLKLYLVQEVSREAKERNKSTWEAARVIQAKRITELANGQAGIKRNTIYSKALLSEYMASYVSLKTTHGYKDNKHLSTLRNLLALFNPRATLGDIDKKFIVAFTDWLRYEYKTRDGKPLAQSSVHVYLQEFNASLNMAVKREIIDINPFTQLDKSDRVGKKQGQREFLTIDEVKQLASTDCTDEMIKRAFLFSCYCGLRLSDIRNLEWRNISDKNAKIIVQKTNKPLLLPLCEAALQCLPKQEGEATDKIFELPSPTKIAYVLRQWTKAANITKIVTFHVARHTFATMGVTLGVPIFTICELLGHSDVTTTQIYAKVVGEAKREAVDLFDKIQS